MRKKIKQLAYGIFDYNRVELSLPAEEIELEIIEGKDAQGEFTIPGNGQKMRGIVYSTCTRMECLTPQFEGEEIKIRYQFHSEGLIEGDVRKGAFVIVCDQGEYHLSFVVSVRKKYAQTSIGVIKTLEDFVRLAKESYEEAYQVFYSMSFLSVLKNSDEKIKLLYEILRRETPSMQAVEAFLAGAGAKDQVKVSLDRERVSFQEIDVSRKEQLCLKQEGWGYVCAQVNSDADFIRLEKTSISSMDFLGSTCFFEYYLDVDAMHAGKNFGRIIFEMPGQTLICEVCARKVVAEHFEEDSDSEEPIIDREELVAKHRKQLQTRMALMQLYIDYRLKKIVTGVWAKESIRLLEQLLEEDEENDLYRLMKAQAFLINRQRQEASWIMDEYKHKTVKRDTPVWGYYLYLCTLMEQEESYVNRIAEEIEELFRLYPDNSMLFWILLFVREDYYKDNDCRRKALAQWMEAGHDSPYFYIEAYYLYMQDPYLLTRLDGFGLRILTWARRQNALTKNIVMQIVHLVSGEIHFNQNVFDLLLACYELGENEEIVTAICSYLIKGQKFEKEYHKWYALGIEYEVRITNLYEAFLLSADEENLAPVPKVVLMYFQYHNSLSYKQLALLYAYVIKNREKAKDVYAKYRRTIEQFAMAQIEAGHMDENLAVIYREMLPLGILNKELAEKFANILFVHKLTVHANAKQKFVRAVLAQNISKQVLYVPIIDDAAYFTAYTKDYSIVLQDAKGYLYAGADDYEEQELLEIDRYRPMVEALAPYTVPCLLETYQNDLEEGQLVADEKALAALLASEELNEEWKLSVFVSYIRQTKGNELDANILEYLQKANYRLLSAADKGIMIEQLIEHHFYEQAYEMLQLYGYDFVRNGYRVEVCSNRITASNFEEEEFLTGLATDTFFAGSYNDIVLIYLCKYYKGPLKQMITLWEVLGQSDIDTYDLEERIITQMLFTDVFVESIGMIYESYCQGGGRELVCMAYLTWFSHQYLVKNVSIPMHVIEENERRLLSRHEMNEVQKFALLKYYAALEQLNDSQYKIADSLLLECTGKGISFGFFKNFAAELQMKYQIYDKYYIEHILNPGMKVRICYCINEGKVYEEELHEVYDGIYVKELVLFSGDKLSYYAAKADGKTDQTTLVAKQIECRENDTYVGENRYTLLNDMVSHVKQQDTVALKKEMSEYYKKMNSTDTIFKLF